MKTLTCTAQDMEGVTNTGAAYAFRMRRPLDPCYCEEEEVHHGRRCPPDECLHPGGKWHPKTPVEDGRPRPYLLHPHFTPEALKARREALGPWLEAAGKLLRVQIDLYAKCALTPEEEAEMDALRARMGALTVERDHPLPARKDVEPPPHPEPPPPQKGRKGQ